MPVNIISHFGELLSYNSNEFFITDSSITILIGVIDHLINFGSWETFTDWCCNFFKVFRSEWSSSVWIKYFVELLEGWFRLSISTNSENFEEEGEVDLFCACCVSDNSEDLFSLIFNAESSNGVDELIGWNVSTVIVVKDVETFLHFYYIIFFKILGGIFLWIKTLNNTFDTLLIFFRYD